VSIPSGTGSIHIEKVSIPSGTGSIHIEKVSIPSGTGSIHIEKVSIPSGTGESGTVEDSEQKRQAMHIRLQKQTEMKMCLFKIWPTISMPGSSSEFCRY